MSSSKITEITEQLAKDYGDYIKVDWDNQASGPLILKFIYAYIIHTCICLKGERQ